MLSLKILLVCVGFGLFAEGQIPQMEGNETSSNLCRPDLCLNSEEHVGCFSNTTYSKKCGKGVHVINVNGALKMGIIERINVLRNYIASGVGEFKPAVKMPTMGWDTNLQRLADLQARQCNEKGKFCANTDNYHYVATTEIRAKIGKRTNVEHVVLSRFLPEVFLDVLGCRMNKKHRLVAIRPGSCVGHYGPLIEDLGNRMGCSLRLKAKQNNYKAKKVRSVQPRTVDISLLCHFSRANVNSMRHYTIGDIPAEKCTTGANQMYPYLCSTQEKVDANSLLGELEQVTES